MITGVNFLHSLPKNFQYMMPISYDSLERFKEGIKVHISYGKLVPSDDGFNRSKNLESL